MGAEPGRRFLKQPTAKLEPEIVVPLAIFRLSGKTPSHMLSFTTFVSTQHSA